jgi:hypothetical protein
MKPPYRQSASLDPTLRAHGCTLFSTLYLQREESGGDISPDTQPAIDEHVRKLRDDAGVSMAQFLARGTTITEADRAYEAQPFPDRLPPLMRLMHGVNVRDELLPILKEGHLALIAVNYGVVQDAGKGVGTFRGGHACVAGEPENGMVTVADPLRSVLVKWPIDLLVKAMETFGDKPWGNGRGEAGVAYPSPTYKAAYTAAAADLKAAKATLNRKAEAIASLNGQVTLHKDERDQARRELTTAQARILELEAATPPDCTAAVNAERQRVLDAMVEALTEAAGSLR